MDSRMKLGVALLGSGHGTEGGLGEEGDDEGGENHGDATDGVGHGVAHHGERAVEAVLDGSDGGDGIAAAGNAAEGDGGWKAEDFGTDID